MTKKNLELWMKAYRQIAITLERYVPGNANSKAEEWVDDLAFDYVKTLRAEDE